MLESKSSINQGLAEIYKEACQNLGRYLDGLNHGVARSYKGRMRQETVRQEVEEYGQESLYHTFETPYVQGYGLVVSTLNILERLNVHTNTDLLGLDIENAEKQNRDFGDKKVELVGLFKEIVRAQKDLEE
ncbi:MAG: hypothetical protein UT24_C0012G0059 [Candidatus Woesebacteria bacterium GW2011_GWB1_39_12]|uniref:Uncharacterized protein n=2 Tax=Candidatus Woeseibacteriota TaxID=1752722 RepID=A0A0G0M0R6_9BACT|nr:MAG: hypothetical protein UT23_C0008G0021 [Candidatus Woesebacteria bacterium GW2011_GWA1_39_12]KKR00437.1 MAG: hypothetical protein UT24_C0012G0059 [Candidatus Woesebacteria bacterium GW2011_GWB1_39_12]